MKYIIALLLALFITSTSAQAGQEVLIFSKDNCPYCKQLKSDLNSKLIAAYPNVTFTVLNIKEEKNVAKLRQLARKHRMPTVGLPLLFVGDTYIMGWGAESEAKLNKLLK